MAGQPGFFDAGERLKALSAAGDPRSKARTRQIDCDGRWTLKRGKKRQAPPDRSGPLWQAEILVPAFGYK